MSPMAKKKATRRDFLTGKAAVRAIDDWLPNDQENVSPDSVATPTAPDGASPARPDTYLIEVSRPAMASEFSVFLNAGQYDQGTETAVEALDLVEAIEGRLSIFREDSEVSLLNQRARSESVAVTEHLYGLLELALELYRETEGAFDITAGPLSKLWGFHRRQGDLPSRESIEQVRRHVGSHLIQLNPARRTVRFEHPELEINFHAMGKGYALDRCADWLVEHDVNHFLLHGGQSSVLARGGRSNVAGTPGWKVALRHPLKSDQRLGVIRLVDRALGTSGSSRQFFYHRGRRFGHVIDPRTGWSVEGVLSATVVAPTAVMADALATAFFVMGVERSVAFCANHPELAVAMVTPGTRRGALQIHTWGFEEGEWQPE